MRELETDLREIEEGLIKNSDDREVIRLERIELDNSSTALLIRLRANVREYNAL